MVPSERDRFPELSRRQCLKLGLWAPFLWAANRENAALSPLAQLESVLNTVRERHAMPAMAAAVLVDARPLAIAATGVRKIGDSQPATVYDRFHLGSCTKAMTAVLIAKLVEHGKLSWNTTLEDALPDIAENMHQEFKRVTVDHLLAHRAGLAAALHPRPTSLPALIESRRSSEASRRQRWDFVAQILRQAPEPPPGSAFVYGNAGYIILGAIVEKVLNMPWEDIVRREIFKPLGMSSAGFGPMGTPGRIDEPWQHRMQGERLVPVEPGPFSDNPPALGPAGTVHCSVGDWAIFLADVLRGTQEDSILLSQNTWQRLLTPQFGGDYAGGWIVTQRSWGGRVLTHAGSNTMSFCVAWLAPEKKFGVAVMTNRGGQEAAQACDAVARAVVESHTDRAVFHGQG